MESRGEIPRAGESTSCGARRSADSPLRHAPLPDGPAALHPALHRTRHQALVQRRARGRRRHQPLRRADDGARRDHRHGKHRRRGDGDRRRRTRRRALDLADGRLRHGHQVRRGGAGASSTARPRPTGRWPAGPCTCSSEAWACSWLGVVFAAFTAVAAFGIGNMVQANSVAVLAHETLRREPVDHRRGPHRPDGRRDPRRHPLDRARVRRAGAVHGDLQHRRLPHPPVHARGPHPRDHRPDRLGRVHRAGGGRRLPRRRRPRGDALRHRARPVLQRGRARLGADRRRRRADDEPRSPGARVRRPASSGTPSSCARSRGS